jgi:hypothetical protein
MVFPFSGIFSSMYGVCTEFLNLVLNLLPYFLHKYHDQSPCSTAFKTAIFWVVALWEDVNWIQVARVGDWWWDFGITVR